MAAVETSTLDDRYLASGDEAGTAPGDRRFRPDVEGLRAVAVVLVVLYHANVPLLTGGYVGVDVFFVISGFVITGLLLRERAATGHTSMLAFYGRRCRRIIPAATLVILVTVLASYHLLGFVTGNNVAVDGRWAGVFLSNFHFQAVGANYLSSFRPPSPLQNFWSLSVEEQFYAVFPLLLLGVASIKGRLSFQARLAISLTVIIVGSFSLSVVQTSTNSSAAYYSPFTRAWELALGALIAIGTRWLIKVPQKTAVIVTWLGIGTILAAALTFDAQSDYPGSLVALPVLGAGFVIAGGAAAPHFGVEALLGLAPFRWLGRLSYSLYLWHWPILILAAESRGETSLPVRQSLWWVAIALVLSIATFLFVENPIRHAKFSTRHRWASIGLGAGLTAITIGFLTVKIDSHGGSVVAAATNNSSLASPNVVRRDVLAADQIRTLPANLTPPVGSAFFDFGLPNTWMGCEPAEGATNVPACTFGDARGTHMMVLYGDSHALMWVRAIDDIAVRAKWKFVLLAKPDCPINMLPYGNPPGFGTPGGEWSACDRWHQTAINRINQLDPELLIVTQLPRARPDGRSYTAAQWQRAMEAALNLVTTPRTMKVVIGDIPAARNGPDCLARHSDDVQACSVPANSSSTQYDRAERAAAAASRARYVDVTPWFCSRVCPAIVGHYEVYVDSAHITITYARFLEGVLGDALQLPVLQPLPPVVPDPLTRLVIPANGSTVSGSQLLDASTADTVAVTKVEFRLTGGTLHDRLIGTTRPTFFGAPVFWNSASIANGTYTLQSVVYDVARITARSKPVTVLVKN